MLVDDNNRVKKGDLLVQLDKEPYQVQVDIKKAAVVSAEADLEAAESQVRGILGPRLGSQRWKLQNASSRSTTRSPSCGPGWRPCGARRRLSIAPGPISSGPRRSSPQRDHRREEFDQRARPSGSAEAAVKQALEEVYADAGRPRPAARSPRRART